MKDKTITRIAQGAMIAALYVALCLVLAPFSYGEIQVRVAEALTILPFFTPAAIPGLFIGCIIANVIGGGIVMDVVFGSLATLIGAIGTYLLRKTNKVVLAPLPPIIANTVIVPFVLKYGYGTDLPIPMLMVTIGVGEVIGCGVFGIVLAKALEKVNVRIFANA